LNSQTFAFLENLQLSGAGMPVAANLAKSKDTLKEEIMLKKTGAIVLAVTFLSLSIAPETLAWHRHRRVVYYRPAAVTYYTPYGARYYSQPYYRTAYYTPYRGVAGTRYYSTGSRYYGRSYYRGHSTRNMLLTIGAPAAIGAGIGAIARGGKGAGIGALIGGGGGALYYLLKHRNRRY